jgi:hypothetical protein
VSSKLKNNRTKQLREIMVTSLKKIKESGIPDVSTICFYSSGDYPPIFFNRFITVLKRNNTNIQMLQNQDATACQAALSQTFLGEQKVYWLGDVLHENISKTKPVTYFLTYKGPHTILFFLSKEEFEKSPKTTYSIPIESNCTYELLLNLIDCFDYSLNAAQQKFTRQFFTRVTTITLDEAFLFLDYLTLTPVITGKQFGRAMLAIFESSGTFFDLSKHFFAKNANAFFAHLQTIQTDYSEPFWISYWADQLWRAYHTTSFLQKKMFAEAKKAAFRLPFSFITQQAQRTSLTELSNAYRFLYDLDYGLKNGKTITFDFFYLQFFNGAFAQKDANDTI